MDLSKLDLSNAERENLRWLLALDPDKRERLVSLLGMEPEIKASVERERSYRLFLSLVREGAKWLSIVAGGIAVFTDTGRAFVLSVLQAQQS